MTTIFIPQISNHDMIAIPKKEYYYFLKFFQYISKDQMWFWSKEWQNKEKDADNDILNGKISEQIKNKKQLNTLLKKMKLKQ